MSFAPFFVSRLHRVATTLWRALALATLVFFVPASQAADGITVSSAVLDLTDDGWQLNAEFNITFSPRLEEAVNRGVPLYFVVDFELARPRWYWFDEKPIQLTQTYKISYTPLLRQYRISVGNASQNFTRFDEVARVLSRLRGLPVAPKGALAIGVAYQASVRMRLDTAQLPKPFQFDAISSRDWSLASDWYRWSVTPSAGDQATASLNR
ncbi:MAG TPA: DUF4390 domain-containing protein [Usitatibacter sp.]|nr:DUF4390 domain-containing protein [Usitatibacter sp.]